MANGKFEESTDHCDWCSKPKAKTRLCRVRATMGNGWLEPMFLCDMCRKSLHGQYKYVKPVLKKENKNAN